MHRVEKDILPIFSVFLSVFFFLFRLRSFKSQFPKLTLNYDTQYRLARVRRRYLAVRVPEGKKTSALVAAVERYLINLKACLPLQGPPRCQRQNGDSVIGVITRRQVLREEYDLEVCVRVRVCSQISPTSLCNTTTLYRFSVHFHNSAGQNRSATTN